MKPTQPPDNKQAPITRCSHDGEACDSLAWAFWKAQRQLVELNLRLAHVKKQLRETQVETTNVNCGDKDGD